MIKNKNSEKCYKKKKIRCLRRDETVRGKRRENDDGTQNKNFKRNVYIDTTCFSSQATLSHMSISQILFY